MGSVFFFWGGGDFRAAVDQQYVPLGADHIFAAPWYSILQAYTVLVCSFGIDRNVIN